jgi:dTMP kinase
MFITLDGIDGGGKSTQVARLCETLRSWGRDVLALRDPGGTPTGEAIRSLLLDSQLKMHRRSEAMLFMAARGELVEQRIRPALRAGQTVVSDRFLLANVVYQSVAANWEPEPVEPLANPFDERHAIDSPLSAAELWRVGHWAAGQLRPDLTLLLDLPTSEAFRRIDRPADRMESRGPEYLEAVRLAFIRELPHAAEQTAVIDAAGSPDDVHRQIVDAVAERLSR